MKRLAVIVLVLAALVAVLPADANAPTLSARVRRLEHRVAVLQQREWSNYYELKCAIVQLDPNAAPEDVSFWCQYEVTPDPLPGG